MEEYMELDRKRARKIQVYSLFSAVIVTVILTLI